jgi:hypothetical protein
MVYESVVKGWLTPPGTNPVTANQAYRHMSRRNVTFYNVGNPTALTLAHQHSAPSWMTPPQDYIP